MLDKSLGHMEGMHKTLIELQSDIRLLSTRVGELLEAIREDRAKKR